MNFLFFLFSHKPIGNGMNSRSAALGYVAGFFAIWIAFLTKFVLFRTMAYDKFEEVQNARVLACVGIYIAIYVLLHYRYTEEKSLRVQSIYTVKNMSGVLIRGLLLFLFLATLFAFTSFSLHW